MQSGSGSGADLKKAAAFIKAFAENAPSEIRDDFRLYAGYIAKIADAFGNVKPGQVPGVATLSKLQKISTEIDTVNVAAAVQRITTWLTKNCRGR